MDDIQIKMAGSRTTLGEEELCAVEAACPDGLSSAEIVDAFCRRGVKFSEATFRKYVQLGLLPRSTRVGTKGKHKGSRGIYPVGSVRQINEIRRMMTLDYTIDEIRHELAFVGGELEELRRVLNLIVQRLERSISAERAQDLRAIGARKQIEEAKRAAEQLMSLIEAAATSIRDNAHLARDAV
jgi:hypothetical protein